MFTKTPRGVEQWQLVGLITQRSVVRIHPPLPEHNSFNYENHHEGLTPNVTDL